MLVYGHGVRVRSFHHRIMRTKWRNVMPPLSFPSVAIPIRFGSQLLLKLIVPPSLPHSIRSSVPESLLFSNRWFEVKLIIFILVSFYNKAAISIQCFVGMYQPNSNNSNNKYRRHGPHCVYLSSFSDDDGFESFKSACQNGYILLCFYTY